MFPEMFPTENQIVNLEAIFGNVFYVNAKA